MMKKIIFCVFLFLIKIQMAFAGGYIAADNIHDAPYRRGILYWILLFWFCFWGWLSSKYTGIDKKRANVFTYIGFGIPFAILIILFIRAVILGLFY